MPGVPNPDTYLNHLPPDQAVQYENARNVYLIILGATVWDILIYIPDDVRIVKKGPFGFVVLSFVLSRLFALTFVLLSVIEKTLPVKNCLALELSIGCSCLIAMSLSLFFLLRRVQAVYSDCRWVKRTFFALWVITTIMMVTRAIRSRTEHIPGTGYCIDTSVKSYVAAGIVTPGIFDTLVFLAISYKVASTYNASDVGITWHTIVSGRALPRLSRAVLQGGQQYYLMTVGINVLVAIVIALQLIPQTYQIMLALVGVPLTASMASRVFRNIKRFDTSETATSQTLKPIGSIQFAHPLDYTVQRTTTIEQLPAGVWTPSEETVTVNNVVSFIEGGAEG